MKIDYLKILFKTFVLVTMVLSVTCCNDNDNEEQVTPIFPETVDLNISQPGEVASFTFEANLPWTLSSSRIWCKFISEEDTLPALQGAAGTYTVSVLLTDDAWKFEDKAVELRMGMASQASVVAKLTRDAQVYTVAAYGATATDTIDAARPVKLLWNSYGTTITNAKLSLTANFNWYLASWPEWVSFTSTNNLSGKAGELVSNTCRFNSADISIRSKLSGDLVYADRDGVERLRIPIYYEGMRGDIVQFNIPNGAKNNFWFDQPGATFWNVSTAGEITGLTEGPLPIEVVASDKQALYTCFLSEDETGLHILPEANRWFSATEPTDANNWTISISPEANNSTAVRKSQVVVLTDSIFNNDVVKGNFSNILEINASTKKSVIKSAYSKYQALAFSQKKPVGELGFIVTASNGTVYPATLVTDADQTLYGTKNVYHCSLGNPTPNQVTIVAKEYENPYLDLVFTLNGVNTKWNGVTLSTSGTTLTMKNVTTSATSTPMVLTYYQNGAVFCVLILQKG
ncbi:MAG: hypothetical protein ACK5JD_09705 [Mangrovibacterium sp.]